MKLVDLGERKKERETRCPWCGSTTVHPDYSCPRIAAVDFGEDWEPVRVEFHDFFDASSSHTNEPRQETEESQP